jgi:predicted GTPase
MGAAGRDFHNFNVYFRDNNDYEVVAFTATQIPNIDDRKYPAVLAGSLYPDGITIYPESELKRLIKDLKVEQVIFAYSDLPYEYVMSKAATVNAAGADFRLMGVASTQLKSTKPVVSVCAVRTGCGKSQTTRRVSLILREMGYKVAAIRHPMPYGDLAKQAVQRFETYADLDKHECTIEEREEYEHISIMVSSFTPAWIMKPFCVRPSRKLTSSCGMAATMIFLSISRTSTLWLPTRTVPGMKRATTRAKQTCAWQMCL